MAIVDRALDQIRKLFSLRIGLIGVCWMYSRTSLQKTSFRFPGSHSPDDGASLPAAESGVLVPGRSKSANLVLFQRG